jgi:hypothetical protein
LSQTALAESYQSTSVVGVAAVIFVGAAASVVYVLRRRTGGEIEKVETVTYQQVSRERARVKYVEYLAKLEELKAQGEVSEETYRKLKDDYRKKADQGAPRLEPLRRCISCGRQIMRESVYCEYCGAGQLE